MTNDILEAKDDMGEGLLTMYLSTFHDEQDAVGDIVDRHAFDNWLAEFKARPDATLPIIYSHSWADPFATIGYAKAEDISIDSTGLKVVGHLDIRHNPTSAQVFRSARSGALSACSFSYDIRSEKRRADGANILLDVRVIEGGPTLVGANAHAGVIDAKARARISNAKALEHSMRKGKLERIASQAIHLGREFPPVVLAELKKYGIPTSKKEMDAVRTRCRAGHYVPEYASVVPGVAPATYCATCDKWQIRLPKSVSDAEGLRQLKALKDAHRDLEAGTAQRGEALKREAKRMLREMGEPSELTESDLVRQYREIEAVVNSKKTESEVAIEKMENRATREGRRMVTVTVPFSGRHARGPDVDGSLLDSIRREARPTRLTEVHGSRALPVGGSMIVEWKCSNGGCPLYLKRQFGRVSAKITGSPLPLPEVQGESRRDPDGGPMTTEAKLCPKCGQPEFRRLTPTRNPLAPVYPAAQAAHTAERKEITVSTMSPLIKRDELCSVCQNDTPGSMPTQRTDGELLPDPSDGDRLCRRCAVRVRAPLARRNLLDGGS